MRLTGASLVLVLSVSFSIGGFVACGGETSSGTSDTDAGVVYDTCTNTSDCVIHSASCCGACGAATRDDIVALNAGRLDAYLADHCEEPYACPACYGLQDPRLVATCTAGKCQVVDLAEHASTACSAASDCRVRAGECCECGAQIDAEHVVAISDEARFGAVVCDRDQACDLCAPVYPPEVSASCTSGHCEAVWSSGGVAGAGAVGGAAGGGATGGVAGGAAAGGSGGSCSPACGIGRECCGGACVNTANDLNNCGQCGVVCPDGTYCDGVGQCATPPCSTTCAGGETCCGGSCCGTGEICCDPQGPLSTIPLCTTPSTTGTCPQGCAPLCICASPDTPIATPTGDRPIATLAPGDLVYSVEDGQVVTVPITRTNRTAVSHHRVVRVELEGGAVLEISPRHPTADGRTFADLRTDDRLDGARITSAAVVPFVHDATYDILPASSTGTYFAGGVLIGSTLAAPGRAALGETAPACEGVIRGSR